MDIGVMLPNGVPRVSGDTILHWARRAEESGAFSVLTVQDRVAYCNLDPVVTLSAVAAVTERIPLMTYVALAGARNAAAFAKEIATLAAFAPGRLTVGVGVGARPDDYTTTGVDWKHRGDALDAALDVLDGMRTRADPLQCLGPDLTDDVRVLVGGASPRAIGRILRHGAGYAHGGVASWVFGLEAHGVREAWTGAGKPGEPRILASTWVASTPETLTRAQAWFEDYMIQGGPPIPVRDRIHQGADDVRGIVEEFARYGAGEVVLVPGVDDLAELDWLVEVALSLRDVRPAVEPEVPVPPAEVLAAMGGAPGGPPPGMGALQP
jgi:alkanesulfonate monooxygenase SsuD/methylene tetrahydromethanopterin reductase-like flavin-dependent oxidoreductase (luciferase family)